MIETLEGSSGCALIDLLFIRFTRLLARNPSPGDIISDSVATISQRYLILLAAAIVAASCGDDPRSTIQNAAPAPEETTVVQGDFKLGVIVPKTGERAPNGSQVANAINLAVEQINDLGGVLGARIQLVERDSRGDPEMGLEAAVLLAQDKDVRAVVGALASSVTEQVVTVTSKSGLPVISPASTSPTLTDFSDGGTFFRTVPSDTQQGEAMAAYASGEAYERAVILFVDDDYDRSLSAEFEAAFEADGGKVAVAIGHKPNEQNPDFTRDLEKVAAQKPTVGVLVVITYDRQAVSIMNAQALIQVKTDYLFSDTLRLESIAQQAGPALLAGVRGTAPSLPTGPAYDAFYADYFDRFGVTPGPFTAQAYDAVFLIALAAVRGGEFSRSTLLEQLKTISGAPGELVTPLQVLGPLPEGDVDFEGSSGPVDWDAQGDLSSATYEIYEFQPDGSIHRLELFSP